MLRLGILFVVLGFGSAIMHFTDIQFRLLMLVEDYQPFFGLGLGLLGAVLIVVDLVRKNQKQQAQAQPAPQQFPQQPGQ